MDAILVIAFVIIWLVTVWQYERRLIALEQATKDAELPFNVTEIRKHN